MATSTIKDNYGHNITALTNQLGNIVYYYKNIGTSYNTLKARLEALMSYSDFPTGKVVCGAFLAGSYHYVSGFVDDNKNGGFVVINFAGGGLFRVQDGVATQI